MNFEQPPMPQEQPRDIFQKALNDELVKMETSGRLTSEQAEEKRRAAALIETGFSGDPKHDALIFSKAGIAEEKEMVDILNKAPENSSLSSEDEISPEEAESPKNIFISVLDQELTAAVNKGEISLERAEEKRKSAAIIETGFSNDPKHDALLFSRAGIADEKEMIELFKRK